MWYHQMDNVVKVVYYKAWKLKTYADVMEIGEGMSKHFIVVVVHVHVDVHVSVSIGPCFRVVNLKCRSVFTLLSEQ